MKTRAVNSGSDATAASSAGKNQVVQRIDGQGLERVDLLGDRHVPDGGRHRRPRPRRHHQRRQHRRQLAGEAQGYQGADEILAAESDQHVVALEGQDQPRENRGQHDDAQRPGADEIDLGYQLEERGNAA